MVSGLTMTFATLSQSKRNKKIRVIYIAKTVDNSSFWGDLIHGAQMAATEYDMDLTIWAPETEDDYETQNRQILKAIEEKPDVIAVSTCKNDESMDELRAIKEHKIKLVLIDAGTDDDLADVTVATDNKKAGNSMGGYVRSLCKTIPKIGIVNHVEGSYTAMERERGFREGLGDYEEGIVAVAFSDSQYSLAYDVTKKMLSEHPDIQVVVGLNENSAVGAARAIKDMGLSLNIQVIGFDSSIEQIQMLEAGVINGLIVQKPFDIGYLGMKAAVDLAKGEKTPKVIASEYKLILKDEIYTPENQKLLFPF